MEILGHPIARSVFKAGILSSFVSVVHDVLFSLFAFSPVELGGIQRTVRLFFA